MPAAHKYIHPSTTSPAAVKLEEEFDRERNTRHRSLTRAWNYYLGKHRKHLESDGSNVDDNVIVNMLGLLVHKSVSGLFGTTDHGLIKGPEIDVRGPEYLEKPSETKNAAVGGVVLVNASPEQVYVDRVFDANERDMLLYELGIVGAITGHVFVRVVGARAEDEETGEMLPKIIILDPRNVSVFWKSDDASVPLWYRIQYGETGGEEFRQDIIRNYALQSDSPFSDTPLEGGWSILEYTRYPNSPVWKQTKSVKWPHGYPPIIDWKNSPTPHSFYGQSEIGNSVRMNDAMNFVASNMLRILKYYANPRTVGIGVSGDIVRESNISNFWTVPNSDAEIYNLEMKGDLGSSEAFTRFLYRALFDVAQELDPTTVQDKLGHLTNFGLRVLYRETLAKISMKRKLFGKGIRGIVRAILELGGMEKLPVTVEWPDPLPADHYETARALEIDINQLGLSRDTALQVRGFDPDTERVKRSFEEKEFGPRFTPHVPGMLGNAGRVYPPKETKDDQGLAKEEGL